MSYAHEDAALASRLASEMESAGARVWLDQGELLIGDSLIQRISDAIAEFDFVAALVSSASVESNWCQKEIALAMSKQLRRGSRAVTVMPLRVGNVDMPASLVDVKWIQLDPAALEQTAASVVADAARHLSRQQDAPTSSTQASRRRSMPPTTINDEPVRILGLDTANVGRPRNDGTRGSGLYVVPLQLNRIPPPFWAQHFSAEWDSPPAFTTMHRPGIATVREDRIILDGTTIDEVEKYHATTLKLVVQQLNEMTVAHNERERQRLEAERAAAAAHEHQVKDVASRIRFD